MAKAKKQAQKATKKHSTKYSKLAAVCSKELAAKKKALATAEKALAKAQRSHSELLSEVARLDMLDRSLNALINGTEPPQNVRYVYSYPQWVYYPYNGWYWNNGNYSLTLGNLQGGTQFTTSNAAPAFTTTNAVNISSPAVYSTCGSGSLSMASAQSSSVPAVSGSFTNCSDSSLIGYNSSGISNVSLTASAPSSFNFTTGPTLGGPTETVDLSTGACDPEAVPEKAEIDLDEALETAEVGNV